MRAVLYTNDMEPITVLNLDRWMLHYLEANGQVRLPVAEPYTYEPLPEDEPVGPREARIVTIRCDWFYRNNQRFPLLFTANESDALLLKSVFLPGQRAAVREAEDKAFSKGVEWLLKLACR